MYYIQKNIWNSLIVLISLQSYNHSTTPSSDNFINYDFFENYIFSFIKLFKRKKILAIEFLGCYVQALWENEDNNLFSDHMIGNYECFYYIIIAILFPNFVPIILVLLSLFMNLLLLNNQHIDHQTFYYTFKQILLILTNIYHKTENSLDINNTKYIFDWFIVLYNDMLELFYKQNDNLSMKLSVYNLICIYLLYLIIL